MVRTRIVEAATGRGRDAVESVMGRSITADEDLVCRATATVVTRG